MSNFVLMLIRRTEMNGNNCLRQFLWFLRIWERRYLSEWLLTHLDSSDMSHIRFSILKLQITCNIPSIKNIRYILYMAVWWRWRVSEILKKRRKFWISWIISTISLNSKCHHQRNIIILDFEFAPCRVKNRGDNLF